MKSLPSRQRQRGVALMAMLAVLILGATWWTVTVFSNPINRMAEQRAQNALVLQQAKAALMGWVSHQAAMAAEADPGRLPCPEPVANIGTADQGLTANTCALPAVGRLPWRTLGLDQLRDAAGEPLWYVVSPNWTLDGVVANTTINSNTAGALTLDAAGDVVAVIIAPGAPISVAASANCLARNQVRPSVDRRDYFECQNAAGAAFASTGPTGSFNDQVLAITGAELLPFIEAAVADRFRRNIAPILRSVYSNVDGTNPSWPNAPRLPFAAQLGNPGPTAPPPIASFKGVDANNQGLLPLTYSTNPATGAACDAAADARCDPNFITWQTPPAAAPTVTGPMIVPGSQTCDATPTLVTCSFRANYWAAQPATAEFTVTHAANNVGLALRQFDTTVAMANVQAAGRTAAGVMNANGVAALSISGTTDAAAGGNLIGALLENVLCGLAGLLGLLQNCANHTITVPIGIMVDHPLIQDNAATNPQHWFLRNRWHQVSFYAVAPETAPGGPGACGANCLTIASHRWVDQTVIPAVVRISTTNQRGLVVIAGRALPLALPGPQNRPPAAATDWLEGINNDSNVSFTVRAATNQFVNRTFNDRIAVIDP